jgi:hypothetical protein
MDDGSGIALHSGLSGRSIFLKNPHNELPVVTATDMLLGTFSGLDLQQLLNVDQSKLIKLESWLIENKFLKKC